MQPKPLLLCDVDGVISLWGFESDKCPPGAWKSVDGFLHFLSARAGEHLQVLARDFDLVWCTGWEEKANDYLPATLGLDGPFPYLSFDGAVTPGYAHWKIAAIERYAGDRALAWIDDNFNDDCRAWAQDRPHPTLLVGTEPATGLGEQHVIELQAFAQRHTSRRCTS